MQKKAPSLLKKTPRLILRPLDPVDYHNWVYAYSTMYEPLNEWDETNWQERELTLGKFKQHLKKQQRLRQSDQSYELGVFRREDGQLIGSVQLMDISRQVFQNACMGYRIFNNHWGQGYGKEACVAALELAFQTLKLHRVEAGIAPTNQRSLRLAKAIGLRKEGLSRKRLYVNGAWVDLVLFAATCEDYGRKFKFPK
jgi:ribosomal-protein-alanine N-acetyltransferase